MTATGWVLYFFIIAPAPGYTGAANPPQITTAVPPQVFATTAACQHALGYVAKDLDTYLNTGTTIRAYCVPQTYKGPL